MRYRLDTLTIFPIVKDFKEINRKVFQHDIIAALSVALLALPQAMAYAFVAELPATAGIYAAVVGAIFASAFGSSKALVCGPSNTIAILIQSGAAEILDTYYPFLKGAQRDDAALQVLLQITLLIGLLQILAGVLRLGRLTQYASRSVLIGYTTGAAFVILISQLFYFLGIRDRQEYFPLYQQIWYLFTHLGSLHLPTAVLGMSCLIFLIFFQRLSDKVPGALIVFTLAVLSVLLLNLSPDQIIGFFQIPPGEGAQKISLLEEYGPIELVSSMGFPQFDFRVILKAVPLALAITLLSALETASLGRFYSAYSRRRYSDNQEIYGLGIANFVSSFFGAMPSSGSLSRTTLNVTTGAKTRFSAIYSGLILFSIVLLFEKWVGKIPLTALSALMLLTAYSMINFRQLKICLKATWSDALVVISTFAFSFLFPLDVAFYIGIAFSIVLYMKQAGSPHLVEYGFNKLGKLRPLDHDEVRPDPRICIVQAEGQLFFGAAEPLQQKIRHLVEDEEVKVVILQVLNARYLDASVCITLEQLNQYLNRTGRILILSGIHAEFHDILMSSGLTERIGEERFFQANEKIPSESTRNAYAYAKKLFS